MRLDPEYRVPVKAVLTLVSSRHEPVFITPMLITYDIGPVVGESMLFWNNQYGNCNTSAVKRVMYDSERPIMVIETRNSVYQIQKVEPVVELK